MAQPFNSPSNFGANTVIQGGLRVGPTYTGIYSNPLSSSINPLKGKPLYSSSAYVGDGSGIYYSPINTYRFKPYLGTQGNIVAGTVVSSPGWLTLNGDGLASTLMRPGSRVTFGQVLPANTALNDTNAAIYQANAGATIAPIPEFPAGAPNNTFLMMDYPRCPAIGLLAPGGTPAAPTAPIVITIFGFDGYFNPIQHKYTIYNSGTAPQIIQNTTNGVTGWLYGADETAAPFQNTKAFYGITGVYCNGTTADYSLYIMTSNTFGLPYAVDNYSQVIQMSLAGVIGDDTIASYDCMNPTYILPNVESDADEWGTFILPEGEFEKTLTEPDPVPRNKPCPVSQIVYNPSEVLAKLDTFIVPQRYLQATAFGGAPEVSLGVITAAPDPGIIVGDGLQATLFSPSGGRYRFKPADRSEPSSTSGDPRGLIMFADLKEITTPEGDPNNSNIMEWGTYLPINGSTEIIFSAYIKGADEQVNVSAAGYQPEGFLATPPAPANTPGSVSPLTPMDLYGNIPFYSGVPG